MGKMTKQNNKTQQNKQYNPQTNKHNQAQPVKNRKKSETTRPPLSPSYHLFHVIKLMHNRIFSKSIILNTSEHRSAIKALQREESELETLLRHEKLGVNAIDFMGVGRSSGS